MFDINIEFWDIDLTFALNLGRHAYGNQPNFFYTKNVFAYNDIYLFKKIYLWTYIKMKQTNLCYCTCKFNIFLY